VLVAGEPGREACTSGRRAIVWYVKPLDTRPASIPVHVHPSARNLGSSRSTRSTKLSCGQRKLEGDVGQPVNAPSDKPHVPRRSSQVWCRCPCAHTGGERAAGVEKLTDTEFIEAARGCQAPRPPLAVLTCRLLASRRRAPFLLAAPEVEQTGGAEAPCMAFVTTSTPMRAPPTTETLAYMTLIELKNSTKEFGGRGVAC
jgi:hypothetical protein